MAEEEKEQEEVVAKEETSEVEAAEEKVHKTEVSVDMSSVADTIAKSVASIQENMQKQMTEEIKKLREEMTPPTAEEPVKEEPTKEEEKSKPLDMTKGVVTKEVSEPEESTDNYVIEKADAGKGFQLSYRNYDDTSKFKRLSR